MSQRLRSITVAAYLLLCILLGGSAQGIWSNLALQLLGIALIVLATIAAEPADDSRSSLVAYGLLGAGALLVLLQLVPLPATVWTELPGRSAIAAAYDLLGEPAPALPLSETPYRSVTTLFALIPGLALFVSAMLLRPSPRWLAFAIVAGMAISIALGALQVAAGRDSAAYLYEHTNAGAVGVFANLNHMGTLLLVSIPFATMLFVSSAGGRGGGSAQGRWAIGIAGLILVAVGLVLNGSLAALALAVPVVLASATLVPAAARWRSLAIPLAGIALAGAIVVLATAPIASTVSDPGTERSITSRQAIWATTLDAVRESFPVGTGLGSFEQVYALQENPAAASRQYVNHAHNDYLQLVLELGAPGLVLILLFLAWWATTAIRVWTSPLSTPAGRAATIASAAILAHSAVDYPLRTAAISAVFAVALALMAQRLRAAESDSPAEQRPTKHVKLG